MHRNQIDESIETSIERSIESQPQSRTRVAQKATPVSLGPGTSALTPTIVNPPRMPARVTTVRKQFDARAAQFGAHDALMREVARRMVERFDLLRVAPATIADVGCGAGHTGDALRARFPKAHWIGIDLSLAMLRLGGAGQPQTPWSRVRRLLAGDLHTTRRSWLCADAAALPLADASVDLVFSNLMAHWHPEPHTLFPEWQRVLTDDGLLMFSAFGPDTLKELRAAALGTLSDVQPMPFVDMHDFGDMLVAAGFATPVMDVETVRLTYASPQELLREVRVLGGNPRDDRRASLVSGAQARALLAALERARAADGRIALTFEIAYGHAWKPSAAQRAKRAPPPAVVSVDSLRAQLRRR
jgi:malonyl-CoA O-methyltransferase